jgi:hypothetical protein
MHPSELKNQALVAAAMAERNGFAATAVAFKLLAIACAEEARELLLPTPVGFRKNLSHSAVGSHHRLEADN